jgi:hypothetical protein
MFSTSKYSINGEFLTQFRAKSQRYEQSNMKPNVTYASHTAEAQSFEVLECTSAEQLMPLHRTHAFEICTMTDEITVDGEE